MSSNLNGMGFYNLMPLAIRKIGVRFLACCATILAIPSCSNDPSDNLATAESVTGSPDEGQIPAKIIRDSPAFNSSKSEDRLCNLPLQMAVRVAKFEDGRYKIFLPSSCGGLTKVWVAEQALFFDGEAYEGKLRQIKSNSAIEVSMAYAGTCIFPDGDRCRIKTPLYGKKLCMVHPEMFNKLQTAALKAKGLGYKLVMLDCYRPIYVQERMASLVKDPKWVAQVTPPRYGGHNGGIAVDVTLVRQNGSAVNMGGKFDEFHPRSYPYNAVGEALENRKTLFKIMGDAGLNLYLACPTQNTPLPQCPGEWWHYSLKIDARPLNLAL